MRCNPWAAQKLQTAIITWCRSKQTWRMNLWHVRRTESTIKQEIGVHFDWQQHFVVLVYTEEGGWHFLPNEFFTNHLFRCNMDVIDIMIAFRFFFFLYEPTRSLCILWTCLCTAVGWWLLAIWWRSHSKMRLSEGIKIICGKHGSHRAKYCACEVFHLGMGNGHQVIARPVCKEIATSSLNRSIIIKWFPASHSAHLKSPLRNSMEDGQGLKFCYQFDRHDSRVEHRRMK